MIQTYNDILQEIQNFQNVFDGKAQIQKIYSSSYYISIQIRLPGVNHFLVLGRGHGQEGLWNHERQIESFLRKRDRFLEYLRKYLSASILTDLDIDSADRIIRLTYRRFGQRNAMMFFYCGRELYFVNRYFNEKKNLGEIFCSWKGTRIDDQTEEDFSLFDEIGRKDIADKTNSSDDRRFGPLIKQEFKKAKATALGGKSLKFLKRKKRKIQEDLKNIENINELNDLTKQDDLSLLETKINIGGVKLKFKSNEHFKRRDEIFIKIKKLKKAKEILLLRLKDTEFLLEQKQDINNFQNTLKTITPLWMSNKNSEEKVFEKGEYKVFAKENFDIGVGITARGNDELRKNWAKKNDIWFHLDGERSPHVILKLKGSLLDENIFQIIGSCLKKFGKIETQELNLVYTEVKNLKGVKGAAGKVVFKKEKRRKVYVEKNFNDLFNFNH